jgi:hypothetical protein
MLPPSAGFGKRVLNRYLWRSSLYLRTSCGRDVDGRDSFAFQEQIVDPALTPRGAVSMFAKSQAARRLQCHRDPHETPRKSSARRNLTERISTSRVARLGSPRRIHLRSRSTSGTVGSPVGTGEPAAAPIPDGCLGQKLGRPECPEDNAPITGSSRLPSGPNGSRVFFFPGVSPECPIVTGGSSSHMPRRPLRFPR